MNPRFNLLFLRPPKDRTYSKQGSFCLRPKRAEPVEIAPLADGSGDEDDDICSLAQGEQAQERRRQASPTRQSVCRIISDGIVCASVFAVAIVEKKKGP
uniref:Uncharacterized protein n=1 Tax=Panagrellus redivivus TaxID=6233 RepID=A0A7E4VTS6_PANRE